MSVSHSGIQSVEISQPLSLSLSLSLSPPASPICAHTHILTSHIHMYTHSHANSVLQDFVYLKPTLSLSLLPTFHQKLTNTRTHHIEYIYGAHFPYIKPFILANNTTLQVYIHTAVSNTYMYTYNTHTNAHTHVQLMVHSTQCISRGQEVDIQKCIAYF